MQRIRINRRSGAVPGAHRRPAQRGVSAVEILTVLAIVAILLSVGVPSLQSYVAVNRVAGASSELYAALQMARSEAVRRGQQVTVRSNGAAGSRDWSGGWTMFVDANRNGQLDGGEEVVRVGPVLPAPLTLFGNANFDTLIAFDSTGRLTNAGGGVLVVCHNGVLAEDGQSRSRAVLVNGAGRVRFARDADKDGVPEKDVGTVGSCTHP
jgi:type IV fimbrial biogenesis protein FimT